MKGPPPHTTGIHGHLGGNLLASPGQLIAAIALSRIILASQSRLRQEWVAKKCKQVQQHSFTLPIRQWKHAYELSFILNQYRSIKAGMCDAWARCRFDAGTWSSIACCSEKWQKQQQYNRQKMLKRRTSVTLQHEFHQGINRSIFLCADTGAHYFWHSQLFRRVHRSCC